MPVAGASADFRVVSVEVEVDPSPDTSAALSRVYSIIREAPTRTDFDYQDSLLDALNPMRSADRGLSVKGLLRAGSPVPRIYIQRAHAWLQLLGPAVQGVTG